MSTSCICFGDPLTQQQKDRASNLRAVAGRAGGRWENPNYPTVVTLNVDPPRPKDLDLLRKGASGTWAERTKGGDSVARGTWRFDEHGAGTLTWQPAGTTRAFLVADSVMALQPFSRAGGLQGDGLVLFRGQFDFEGLGSQAVLSTEQHQNRIRGKWTHANLDHIHEATNEGMWVERRKKGGVHSHGLWQAHDDGTYVVQLENKWKLRVWPAGQEKLVLIWFDPDGGMVGDGAILNRQ